MLPILLALAKLGPYLPTSAIEHKYTHLTLSRIRTVALIKLKDRYTKDEAKKAKDVVSRRVKNGSLEVNRAQPTRRTSPSGLADAELERASRASASDL